MNAASKSYPLIAAALAELAAGSLRGGPERWEATLSGNARVEVFVAGSWLVMISPVAAGGSPADLLKANACLPAWVKFAHDANGRPQIRAEIPIDGEPEAARHVHEAWTGFEAAHALIRGEARELALPEPLPEESRTAVMNLCVEGGWNATLRGETGVAVDLECNGAFHQAIVSPAAGGLCAAVELVAGAEPEALEAVACFLLDASATVRMVRPAARESDGKFLPRFEFILPANPGAALPAHAFSALSVACGLCAEEVKALWNTNVAGEYLALRRPAMEPVPVNQQT